MEYIRKRIDIASLRPNTGQVPGLPINPRKISKDKLLALEKSLRDFPDMLDLRPLIVVPFGDLFVAVGGNHRLRAATNIGMGSLPCVVVPADTPPARLREIAAKDNLEYAETVPDLLEFWDKDELVDWDALPPIMDADFGVEEFDGEEFETGKRKAGKDFKVCPKCGFKWN